MTFVAMAEKGADYVPKGGFGDDFETGETIGSTPTKWVLEGYGAVSIAEENGNKFMHIERGIEDGGKGKSQQRPHVHNKTNLGIPFASGTGTLIVEAKMRASTTGYYRNMLRITGDLSNYGRDSAGLYDNNAPYALFITEIDGSLQYMNGKWSHGYPKFTSCSTGFSANTWYKMKAVINLNSKTAKYYVDNTYMGEGSLNSNNMAEMATFDELGFTIGFAATVNGAAGYGIVEPSTLDVDDVKVYKVITDPTAELIAENGTIPANNAIGIKFDKYMDVDSLTSDTVKLYDSEGTEIICTTRSYDAENSTYYLTSNEWLTAGEEYTVELSDEIYADNTDDYYSLGAIAGTKSFTFTATNAKSNNAKLATLMLDGVEIEGFDSAVYSYELEIPFVERENIPVVTVVPEDENATVEITQVEELPGVATVHIMAENEITELTYTVDMKLGRDFSKIGLNLLTNPGFETGDATGWTGQKSFSVSDIEEAADGGYYGVLKGRTNSPWAQYRQSVSAEGGKTYIVSAKVKLCNAANDGAKFDIFVGSDYTKRPENTIGNQTNLEIIPITADAWYQVISTIVTTRDTTLSPTALCWTVDVDYMVDDHFIGELKPTVNYTGKKEIAIPNSGSATLALSASITNQLGTINGVKDEKIEYWDIVGEPYGVSISGDNLIVQADADPGEIEIEAVMIPKFVGAYTDELREKVIIKLISNGNKKPQAKEVKILGTVEDGSLEASYRYYQEDGKEEGETEIQWYEADSPEGPFKAIDDAEDIILDLDEYPEYTEKVIKVGVTPVSADGEEGKEVMSASIAKAKPPVAKDVEIIGDAYVGSTLTGSYTYTDINSDEENLDSIEGTSFCWLRAESEDGDYVPIDGATKISYKLTDDDIDSYIKFSVTPVAVNDSEPGATAESPKAVKGPTRPEVSNVSIEFKGNSLYGGNYKYNHPNGVAEGKSICKWYVNDKYVSSGTSFSENVKKGDVIKFEVTPVAAFAPFEGETKSATLKVASKPNLGGGNGGGGGGSVAGSAILPVIPVEPEIVPVPETPAKHWAADAIEFVTSRGIMENVAENDFGVNLLVDRKDFLKYVLTALGFEGTEYKGEFNDISATDEIAPLLQTAVDEGIISKDTLFNPERSVSREEVCKIIMLALAKKTEISANEAGELSFADSTAVASWAVPFVTQAVNSGIFKGVSETEFAPKGQVTRAQTATLVQRIVNYAMLG